VLPIFTETETETEIWSTSSVPVGLQECPHRAGPRSVQAFSHHLSYCDERAVCQSISICLSLSYVAHSMLLKIETITARILQSSDAVKVKGEDHTLDIAPLGDETSLQKRSGTALVVEGFHSLTCTLIRLSTNGINHTRLCLPSRSWSSFTNLGGMKS